MSLESDKTVGRVRHLLGSKITVSPEPKAFHADRAEPKKEEGFFVPVKPLLDLRGHSSTF